MAGALMLGGCGSESAVDPDQRLTKQEYVEQVTDLVQQIGQAFPVGAADPTKAAGASYDATSVLAESLGDLRPPKAFADEHRALSAYYGRQSSVWDEVHSRLAAGERDRARRLIARMDEMPTLRRGRAALRRLREQGYAVPELPVARPGG